MSGSQVTLLTTYTIACALTPSAVRPAHRALAPALHFARARASLVTRPHIWTHAVAPVTISEQVCRSPFVKNYYYIPKDATLEEFDNCLYARSLVMTYGTSFPA